MASVRVAGIAILSVLLSCGPALAEQSRPALRFAWPAHGDATVELTDERSVGDESRTIVMTMRLRVEREAGGDRFIVRLSDARLVSIDGRSAGAADPKHTLLAVGRVMKSVTPTMVVDRDGRFLETRGTDRMVLSVLQAAGFSDLPPSLTPFAHLLSDVAAEDWSTWVGAWVGDRLGPGESNEAERDMLLNGSIVPVRLKRSGLPPSEPHGRTRLEASAVYAAESVRDYTSGFLVDLAREAKELGDDDPAASLRFLQSAHYGPMTQTLTVELETGTMRPLFAERLRTFSATKGRHKVDGRERRAHRFTWEP
jgi:hypothetical protein